MSYDRGQLSEQHATAAKPEQAAAPQQPTQEIYARIGKVTPRSVSDATIRGPWRVG